MNLPLATKTVSEPDSFQSSMQKQVTNMSTEDDQTPKVAPIQVQPPAATPADGGFEAWLKVAGSSLLLMNMT